MRSFRFAVAAVAVVVAIGLTAVVVQRTSRMSSAPAPKSDPGNDHAHDTSADGRVTLTPQALANLHVTSEPLRLETYWKTIQLPGEITDRPGISDRGVVSPSSGVVTRIHRLPGDTVRPGEELFTLRLLSEPMQLAQTELLKASRETQITKEMKQKLEEAAASGGIAQVRITELDNELRRLAVSQQAYRLELATRGLTPAQIENVAQGEFVVETKIGAPQRRVAARPIVDVAAQAAAPAAGAEAVEQAATGETPWFEVQELKVELGQQVQAGQTLCVLSQHAALFIEGRAFRREVPLLQKAVEEEFPVYVEFMEDDSSRWPPLSDAFLIHHIANTADPASHTFAFYLPLANQSRSYQKEGRTMLLWRFRPGQRMRITVRVEELPDVFVLPADAVAREGPLTYVFRHNGNGFDRKPVHLVYQDRLHAVIANDGSIPPGVYVAQNAATQLNRVLKAASGGATHAHHHFH